MRKKFKILLIILIVIIIGYVSYSFYKSNTKKVKAINDSINVIKQDDSDSSELFGNYYKKASKTMKVMTLEEKIGQLFLVRYNENVDSEIFNYFPGGYILFARDFQNEDKNSITEKLSKNQSESKIPLILGVDEEGGTVTRVSRFANFRNEKFKSPQDIYNEGGYDLLETTENEKNDLLLSLGINMNLAPVADISTDPGDFIYERSFGKGAKETADYVKNMVIYASSKGISSTLKHFPGYGNNVDTHTGIAIDNRSIDSFKENDFLPFIAGIEENVPTILVSHNIVNCMDDKYPASLSKNVHQILRNDLGFSGIIMTDDLAMDAVKSYAEEGDSATLAINAGNDMIITTDFVDMYDEVLENVNNNKISEDTINIAVKRIIAWKLAYGLYK